MTMKKSGPHLMSFYHGGAAVVTLYPSPKKGIITTPVNGMGASTSSTESPFQGTSKDAVIYSITLTGVANADYTIRNHLGSVMFHVASGSARIASTMNFGPKGVRVPGGFRVTTDNLVGVSCIISYDVI